MSRFSSRVALVWSASIVIVAAAVWAQQPDAASGASRKGSEMLRLLRFERVQKEIELVDNQKTKLRELSKKLTQETLNVFAGAKKLSAEEWRAKSEEFQKKAADRDAELVKQIGEILLPHQVARLKEIRCNPEVEQRLESLDKIVKLTEAQRKAATGIFETREKAMKEAFEKDASKAAPNGKDGFIKAAKERRATRAEISKKYDAEVEKVLTPEQREAWKKAKPTREHPGAAAPIIIPQGGGHGSLRIIVEKHGAHEPRDK